MAKSLPRDVVAVDAEPIGGTGLWRARWRQIEVFPVGPKAEVRSGRAGWVSETAALEAAQRFALEHGQLV